MFTELELGEQGSGVVAIVVALALSMKAVPDKKVCLNSWHNSVDHRESADTFLSGPIGLLCAVSLLSAFCVDSNTSTRDT